MKSLILAYEDMKNMLVFTLTHKHQFSYSFNEQDYISKLETYNIKTCKL